jgi:hypothetical protein
MPQSYYDQFERDPLSGQLGMGGYQPACLIGINPIVLLELSIHRQRTIYKQTVHINPWLNQQEGQSEWIHSHFLGKKFICLIYHISV